jgi:hypothetical protein
MAANNAPTSNQMRTRMKVAGIAAIDHLIMIVTIRQKGTSMSRMVTEFPSVMALPMCLRR